MFREDSKRFYKELGKKTIQTEKLTRHPTPCVGVALDKSW